jgi:hypothetical protein
VRLLLRLELATKQDVNPGQDYIVRTIIEHSNQGSYLIIPAESASLSKHQMEKGGDARLTDHMTGHNHNRTTAEVFLIVPNEMAQ